MTPPPPLTVWVVEDEAVDQWLITAAFRQAGAPEPDRMLATADEVMELLDAGEVAPDLMIVDLETPGIGGIELIRRLRAQETTAMLPMVVLTSSESERDRLRSAAAGANAYHVKPFDWQEFNRVIAALLAYWELAIPRRQPNR